MAIIFHIRGAFTLCVCEPHAFTSWWVRSHTHRTQPSVSIWTEKNAQTSCVCDDQFKPACVVDLTFALSWDSRHARQPIGFPKHLPPHSPSRLVLARQTNCCGWNRKHDKLEKSTGMNSMQRRPQAIKMDKINRIHASLTEWKKKHRMTVSFVWFRLVFFLVVSVHRHIVSPNYVFELKYLFIYFINYRRFR